MILKLSETGSQSVFQLLATVFFQTERTAFENAFYRAISRIPSALTSTGLASETSSGETPFCFVTSGGWGLRSRWVQGETLRKSPQVSASEPPLQRGNHPACWTQARFGAAFSERLRFCPVQSDGT